VSLDEVAIALNVSKPTLYNYVKSKHELLYECYNLALDFGDEVIRDVMAQGGTGLDKLCAFIRRFIKMLTEELGPAAVFYEFYSMRPSDREKIQRRRRGFDPGDNDGVIGPKTRVAIRQFQREIGEVPDGFATLALLTRLRALTSS
jgi:AcrR family transcriptional regulator